MNLLVFLPFSSSGSSGGEGEIEHHLRHIALGTQDSEFGTKPAQSKTSVNTEFLTVQACPPQSLYWCQETDYSTNS